MNTRQVKLPNGYTLKTNDVSDFIINEIWHDKIYEQDFTIMDNMTIIDIGANQGIFSLYAAAKGAQVYSIEPEETNYKILNENIELNDLQDRITTFQAAVSKREGFIDFFLPSVDNAAYPGMNSTNQSFADNLKSISNFDIQKKQVKAISLDTILKQIPEDKIDLLKIDCEGAELDVIESGSPEILSKVNNIVMELHKGYSQRALFYGIKKLGFHIVTYEKLSGLFEGGYLFASRFKDMKVFQGPVSFFNLAPVIKKNEEVMLDSSHCFSALHEDGELDFTWHSNGEKIYEGKDRQRQHRFETSGYYKIELQVNDGNLSDRHERNIYVIDENYYENKIDFILKDMDDFKTIKLKRGKNYFKIPSGALQKEWKPVYQFSVEEVDLNNQKIEGRFYFNGKQVILNDHYHNFLFDNIPLDFDIIFYLELAEERELEIGWCIK